MCYIINRMCANRILHIERKVENYETFIILT